MTTRWRLLDSLLEDKGIALKSDEREALMAGREQYVRDLAASARWTDILYGLETVGLRRPIKFLGRMATQLGDRLRKDRTMTEYNWTD
jgi:hypothetical protein